MSPAAKRRFAKACPNVVTYESISKYALDNFPNEFRSLPAPEEVLSSYTRRRCRDPYSKIQPEFSLFHPVYRLIIGSGIYTIHYSRSRLAQYECNIYLYLGHATNDDDMKVVTGTKDLLVDSFSEVRLAEPYCYLSRDDEEETRMKLIKNLGLFYLSSTIKDRHTSTYGDIVVENGFYETFETVCRLIHAGVSSEELSESEDQPRTRGTAKTSRLPSPDIATDAEAQGLDSRQTTERRSARDAWANGELATQVPFRKNLTRKATAPNPTPTQRPATSTAAQRAMDPEPAAQSNRGAKKRKLNEEVSIPTVQAFTTFIQSYHALQAQVTTLRTRADKSASLQASLTTATQQVAEAQQQLTTQREEHAEQTLATTKAKQQLEDALQAYKTNARMLNADVQTWKNRVKVLEDENVQLKTRVAGLKAEVDKAAKGHEAYKKRVRALLDE